VAERGSRSRIAIAEEVALLHRGEHRLAVLDPLLDRDAARLDDVHLVALVAFVEEDGARLEVRQELGEGILVLVGHRRGSGRECSSSRQRSAISR
jgi:hypothetical protein